MCRTSRVNSAEALCDMCILYGDNFRNSELLCEALRDVFVYVDFSGIFNRMPVGRILELQELAKEMFKPKGILKLKRKQRNSRMKIFLMTKMNIMLHREIYFLTMKLFR